MVAYTQTILLADQPELARAEWKAIRYRLLHTAARITRSARQTWLRLAAGWPWTLALARAFTTLRRIPLPASIPGLRDQHQPGGQLRHRLPALQLQSWRTARHATQSREF